MIGIVALVLGYPYHLSYVGLRPRRRRPRPRGASLVYLSLLFSFASAAQYVGLFADAVEANEKRRDASA